MVLLRVIYNGCCRRTLTWPACRTWRASRWNFPRDHSRDLPCELQDQIAPLRAAVGNALTTVLAGFALTTTSLPNIIFLEAFVAGFLLVLILARPGIVNTPDFFTSAVPTSAKLAKSFMTTLFFSSQLVARASAMVPLVMAFVGAAFIPFGAMAILAEETSS